MALWALWNSSSYSGAVRLGVNLLGDADTVPWLARVEVGVSEMKCAYPAFVTRPGCKKGVPPWGRYYKGILPFGGLYSRMPSSTLIPFFGGFRFPSKPL